MFPKPLKIERTLRSRTENKLDDVLSLIVRIQAKWKCKKCKKHYPPVMSKITGLPAQNLMTCSHFFNKWKAGTRWELDNLDAICLFCHGEIEQHKHESVGQEYFNYEFYMTDKLGSERFYQLEDLSNKVVKISTVELEERLVKAQRVLQYLLAKKIA